MNRIYEEMFILKPDTPEEEIDGFIEQMKSVVTSAGGAIDKADKWGIRRLAYRIDKRDEGFYVLLQFTSGPQVVRELERRLRVSDMVMKFITVRIDERMKKIEKRRKEREKRAKRKPAPAPAPAAALGMPARPAEQASVPGRPVEPEHTEHTEHTEPVEKES